MNRSSSRHRPSPPVPDERVMYGLLHAAHALEARLEESLAGVGLSMAKFRVLTLLVEAGEPIALSELAAMQRCVRSNMTQLVDRLEADGLVKRVDHPEDRRSVRAALTSLGRDRQAAGAERVASVRSGFAGTLAEGDRAVLERVLEAVQGWSGKGEG